MVGDLRDNDFGRIVYPSEAMKLIGRSCVIDYYSDPIYTVFLSSNTRSPLKFIFLENSLLRDPNDCDSRRIPTVNLWFAWSSENFVRCWAIMIPTALKVLTNSSSRKLSSIWISWRLSLCLLYIEESSTNQILWGWTGLRINFVDELKRTDANMRLHW